MHFVLTTFTGDINFIPIALHDKSTNMTTVDLDRKLESQYNINDKNVLLPLLEKLNIKMDLLETRVTSMEQRLTCCETNSGVSSQSDGLSLHNVNAAYLPDRVSDGIILENLNVGRKYIVTRVIRRY